MAVLEYATASLVINGLESGEYAVEIEKPANNEAIPEEASREDFATSCSEARSNQNRSVCGDCWRISLRGQDWSQSRLGFWYCKWY